MSLSVSPSNMMGLLTTNLVELPLFSKLSMKCLDFKRRSAVWDCITMYYKPSDALFSKSIILPQRIGEPLLLYQRRLDNFIFTPMLYNSIKDFVKGLKTSPVVALDETEYIERLDGSPFSWNILGGEICRNWMTFGRCVLIFDGTEVQVIDPRALINYGAGFWVLALEKEINVLFGNTRIIKTWLVIKKLEGDNNNYNFTKYESEEGKIPEITLNINYDFAPIAVLDCSEDIFVASRTWALQRLHTLLDNWILDSASNLYIQKNVVQKEADANTYIEEEGQFSSNGHFFVGDFRFTEASGTSVTTTMALLKEVEEKIRDTVSMTSIDSSLEESGEAKKYDKYEQDSSYKAVGGLVKKALGILSIKFLNKPQDAPIEFAGYSQYEVDFGAFLERTQILASIEKIPDSIWSVWMKRLEDYISI